MFDESPEPVVAYILLYQNAGFESPYKTGNSAGGVFGSGGTPHEHKSLGNMALGKGLKQRGQVLVGAEVCHANQIVERIGPRRELGKKPGRVDSVGDDINLFVRNTGPLD
jgi:hypothetical protein